MSTELRDEDLERRVRAVLERSVETLDPATLGRLRAARRDALAGVGRARRRSRALVWAPLGALAAAALALLLARGPSEPVEVAKAPPPVEPRAVDQTPPAPEAVEVADAPPPPRLVEDLEVVTSSDDLELYADLEFYEWLDRQDPTG